MKLKKILVFLVVGSFFVTCINPQTTQAVDTFSTTNVLLSPVSDGDYLMLYKHNLIRNERIANAEIKARICERTPTEFKTIEEDDASIMNWQFTPEYKFPERENPVIDYTHNTTQTAFIYYNEISYLFIASENLTSHYLEFFLLYSEDNGETWSDLVFLNYTQILFSRYIWFDVTVVEHEFQEKLYLACSYTGDNTYLLYIDPVTLEVDTEELANNYFGDDFDIFRHDDLVYLVSTKLSNIPLFNATEIRFTYLFETDSLYFGEIVIEAPDQRTDLYYPSLTFWDNQFLIVAQDRLLDVYDAEQGIEFEEFYLWGVLIDDMADTNPSYITVIKGNDEPDGYYRMLPSVTVYEENIFIAYLAGEGVRFGGGRPNVDFIFSTDGDVWTSQYMGQFSFFLNPGVYFAFAVVGCFAIVLPSYYFYNRYKKGK
ncbi:MAG: hypothetical protein HGN29_09415 [Asgard group archaeon]|nr:hypothetical protein [Asgard group archaeon]